MSLFIVDEKKCKRDGVCVAVCPRGLIELKENNSIPTPTQDANELCSRCGHCVAVCPQGALSHTAMKAEECPPVMREWLLNPQKVEHFLRSRRSIRNYRDKKVEREVLIKLIDIARYAPSGGNSQPVHWLVIYDTAEVQRLAGMVIDWMRHVVKGQEQVAQGMKFNRTIAAWEAGKERVCRGAPHLVLTHAPKNIPWVFSACAIALTYLELAAPSFGLGVCWAGFLHEASTVWPPLIKSLGLPEGHTCFGAMMIGYPKYTYHRLPLRNEARILWHTGS